MNVKELLRDVRIQRRVGHLRDLDVCGLTDDSRDVKEGVVFVAVRGPLQDGHVFIAQAVKKGAAAILLSDKAFLPKEEPRTPYLLVEDSRASLSKVADSFFGNPYSRIRAVGITGTNGKTTVSYLVKSVLESAGKKCGVIGTIGYRVAEANINLSNTTPGVIELHRVFKEMADADNTHVAMEVSSHALDQGRVAGIKFCAAIFTNLTQDHLDYHKTMDEYFFAKQKLFKENVDQESALVMNLDDSFGRRLLDSSKGRKLSYGFSSQAEVVATDYVIKSEGSFISIKTPLGDCSIKTALVGKHNISNILAAVAFGVSQKFSLKSIKNGIEAVSSVAGRLDRIDSSEGFSVFVDYAHTDDALKNVLESLRSVVHNGKIITVFGCGGDRDKGKRPKMGRVASALSDHCVITSDNPRSEDPKEIIRQIVSGIKKKNFEIESDRALAIHKACSLARKGDIVLVAGKGHETYQVEKDKILPFDDRVVVRKALSQTDV
jgi:UDP-N-acetylmuramoyl-L-alanyl-D-glutamate--2,6-diaminopimelate ligase